MIRSLTTTKKWARALLAALGVAICAGYVMAAGPADSNQIRDIQVSQKGSQTTVIITGSVRPMYTAFKLSSPGRLVIDLANSHVKGVPAVSDQSTSLIDGVAVSQFTSGKVPVSRVMIGFKTEAAYRVKVDGNRLVVTLSGGPASSSESEEGPSAEQEISLSSANAKIAEVQKSASEEIERARESASREVARANAEAEEARTLWRQASAELNKAKAQSDKQQQETAKAAAEAEAAAKALKEALARQEKSRAADLKNLSAEERRAAAQLESLSAKMAQANAEAASERKRREQLEKRLVELQSDLENAQKEAVTARNAQIQASQLAQSMKARATEATLATSRAKEKAKVAMDAQTAAARAYSEAAKEEQAKLREVLAQREKETVVARRELENAKSSQAALDGEINQVFNRLKAAERRSADAERRKAELEKLSAAEKASSKDRINKLSAAVSKAEQEARDANAARVAAEAQLARTRTSADSSIQSERAIAAAAVEDAKKKMAAADKARKDAEARAASTAAGLNAARDAENSARKHIDEVEKKLLAANSTIARQQDRIRELEAQAAKEQAEKVKAAEIASAKVTPAAPPPAAIAPVTPSTAPVATAATILPATTPATAAPKKLSQEELRLQRLAEMEGKKPAPKAEGVKTPEPAPVKTAAGQISDIRFVNSAGSQKIVIAASGTIRYAKSGSENRLILEFSSASLDPSLERTLDVRDFGGAIDKISSYQKNGKVVVEAILGNQVKTAVREKDGNIEWIFESPKSEVPTDIVRPSGTNTRVVYREDGDSSAYPQERTAAYSVKLGGMGRGQNSYTGRRIDLDFKDADIHNILRLLSDVGQVNIITADNVSGSITIRMRNVPWDQALDVILQTKGLGKIREGNLIRVAPMETLEKEFEREMERIAMSRALEPLETRLIPISYATADELMPRAEDLLTDRGKLSVDSRTNVIVARDTAQALDQIEALIRNLDTQTPQVLIEGRIVEATSTYAREIGIQWGGDFSASAATGNPTGLAFPSSIGVAGGATDDQAPTAGLSPVAGAQPNPNYAVNLPAPAGTGSGGALGIALGSIANNANLNLRLSAMEEEGTLRILSSPKILTLDNRKAYIEQGTMIPYSRVSASGVQTAFKEAKLNLTVTPHVTADGGILMQINMTRDEPDFNNKGARGDPTILKREASTELLVSDGHTAVIGGIFTRNHGQSFKKVPFFGDIPVLGWLFKTRSDSDRRTEMLIFITPTIVNRAESIGQ